MLAISDTNRLPAPDHATPRSALLAYLAGLGTGTVLIVGAAVVTSLGLASVFG